jgi:hypothetical protein
MAENNGEDVDFVDNSPMPQEEPASAPDSLAEGEAKLAEAVQKAMDPNLKSDTEDEEPKAPEPDKPKQEPSQSKEDDGKVDEEAKLQKSTQHLEKSIEEKQAAREKYKELQRTFTKLAQDTSATKKELAQSAEQAVQQSGLPQAEQAQLREALEKDFEGTLLQLVDRITERKLAERERENMLRQRESSQLEWLDKQVESGNNWLLEPKWVSRINAVLDERPWLRDAPNPFAEAVHYLPDAPVKANSQKAQGTPLTPILGTRGAEPPPSSAPVSPQVKLEKLGQRLTVEQDPAESAKIRREMDRILADQMKAIGIG